jgi:hypothetical protein
MTGVIGKTSMAVYCPDGCTFMKNCDPRPPIKSGATSGLALLWTANRVASQSPPRNSRSLSGPTVVSLPQGVSTGQEEVFAGWYGRRRCVGGHWP